MKADFETLAAELLKERPNLTKIAQMTKNLGLSWDGDLVQLMAQVLDQAPRRRPRKSLEIDL